MLFSTLDSADIAYEKRVTDRGIPYAGFALVSADGDKPTRVTAIIENGVLRLSAHNLQLESLEPLDIQFERSRIASLPLGAFYESSRNGLFELAIGIYIGTAILSSAQLLEIIDYMSLAISSVETDAEPPSQRPKISTQPQSNPEELAAAIRSYGHDVKEVPDGCSVELTLHSGQKCLIEVSSRSDAWFIAKGRYSPETRLLQSDSALLQKLQHWTRAGRFCLGANSEVRAEVATPNLGQLEKDMIVWTVSQAAAMLDVAATHHDRESSKRETAS